MNIQPVIDYKVPDYPTLENYCADPTLFVRNVPDSWRNNKIVWATLLSFAASSLSCNFNHKPIKNQLELSKDHHDLPIKDSIKVKLPATSMFVAPLFQHGEGIGVFGCVVMMPPVFI